MNSNVTDQVVAGLETIKQAIDQAIGDIRGAARQQPAPTDLRTIQCPPIGAKWPEHGGLYMGIARGQNGNPDYHLILAEVDFDKKYTHDRATEFARSESLLGFRDWHLPNRTDGALIHASGVFSKTLHRFFWLQEASDGFDAYAWCQHFNYGNQGNFSQSDEIEVVLVRRVPIR